MISETFTVPRGKDQESNAKAMASVDPHPFEGPEKTLEIDFVPGVVSGNAYDASKCTCCLSEESLREADSSVLGLRILPRSLWDTLLEFAKCMILSAASNECFDAYVLSESSLFVYPFKIVIKTCGTTTLLRLVPYLLEATVRGGMKLEWLGYTRKSLQFPQMQLFPHSSIGEEVTFLKNQCKLGCEAYILGPITSDHWVAIVADYCERPMSQSSDRTLNIMMYGIADDVCDKFFARPGRTVENVRKDSGLLDLLPGVHIQDFLFDPCGYSMNGLHGSAYYTVHVTPEKSFSYISFETNARLSDYTDLVCNIQLF